MSILDLLFGESGLLGSLFKPGVAQAQTPGAPPAAAPQTPGLFDALFGGRKKPVYDWEAPESSSGLFGNLQDRKSAITGYLSGALMPGTTQEKIARGLAGATAGRQNDILQAQRLDALRQQQEQRGAAASLIDKFQNLPPEQKRFFAANPGEFAKVFLPAVVTPKTSTIGKTVIQDQPMGGVKGVFREPQEPVQVETLDNDPQSPTYGQKIKKFVQPPEPFGFYGAPTNPVVPGRGGAPAGAQPGGLPTELSPSQVEESKKRGEIYAKSYQTLLDSAASARKRLPALQRMEQLSPDAYQGASAPGVQMFRSALSTFGVDPGKVPKGEEFNALSNRMVLDYMPNGSLGAQVSNSDRDFVASTVPQLNQTKEGRLQLIKMASLNARREMEVAR